MKPGLLQRIRAYIDDGFFSVSRIILLIVGFGLVIAVGNRLIWLVRQSIRCDCPPSWPISIIRLQPMYAWRFGAVVLAALIFAGIIWRLFPHLASGEKRKAVRLKLYFLAIVTIAASTFIHGWTRGFAQPVGLPDTYMGRMQYIFDAVKFQSASECLSGYHELQYKTPGHSRTHPPGALLFFWTLDKIIGDRGLIGVVILLISGLTVITVYGMVRLEYDERVAENTAITFAILPAFQVYAAAFWTRLPRCFL